MIEEVRSGRIEPVISHVLPLEQAREAEELIEDRGIFGKVLLEP